MGIRGRTELRRAEEDEKGTWGDWRVAHSRGSQHSLYIMLGEF